MHFDPRMALRLYLPTLEMPHQKKPVASASQTRQKDF